MAFNLNSFLVNCDPQRRYHRRAFVLPTVLAVHIYRSAEESASDLDSSRYGHLIPQVRLARQCPVVPLFVEPAKNRPIQRLGQ